MNWNHTCGAEGLWSASGQMDHGEDLLWWKMEVKLSYKQHSSLLCQWEYLRSEVTVEFYHCLQGGEHWIMMLLACAISYRPTTNWNININCNNEIHINLQTSVNTEVLSQCSFSTAQRRIFISSTSHPRTLMLAQLSFLLLMPCVYVCIHTRILAILFHRRQGEVHHFPLTRLYPECRENRKRGPCSS